MSQKKNQSLLRGRVVIAALLGLIAAAALAGIVAAKYASAKEQEAEIHAYGFHFSSDYLEAGGATLSVSDWDTQGIVFRLYNYEKENTAQISDTAMDYELTVPDGWQIDSVKTDQGERVSAVNSVYTMEVSDTCAAHIVTLKYVGNAQPADAVEITAATVSPYEKELKATFQLSSQNGPTFTAVNEGGAVCLTIYSNNYAGPVVVKWPQAEASPDNVNSDVDMSAWQNSHASSGETFTAEAHHTYTLYFMKNHDNDISESEFSVERGN